MRKGWRNRAASVGQVEKGSWEAVCAIGTDGTPKPLLFTKNHIYTLHSTKMTTQSGREGIHCSYGQGNISSRALEIV